MTAFQPFIQPDTTKAYYVISYDYFYYAIQTIEKSHDINFVLVTIYDTATDHAVDSFMPARARDFWGICWDRNSYNIWTQSADVGIYCYE